MQRALTLLIAILLVSSCNTQKRIAKRLDKDIKKAKHTFADNPAVFAEACAVQFPPRIFDSTPPPVVEFKKGGGTTVQNTTSSDQTDVIIALLQSNEQDRKHLIDSFKKHPFVVKADCPPVYVPYPDTITSKQDHYKIVESTSKVVALQNKNDSLLSQKATAEAIVRERDITILAVGSKLKTAYWGIGIILLLILAYVFLKFRKIIP